MGNTVNKLLLQKLALAFAVGFVGALLTSAAGWGDSPNTSWGRAFWIGLLVGAVSAGARAVLALGPFNVVPSDTQHSLFGNVNQPPTE